MDALPRVTLMEIYMYDISEKQTIDLDEFIYVEKPTRDGDCYCISLDSGGAMRTYVSPDRLLEFAIKLITIVSDSKLKVISSEQVVGLSEQEAADAKKGFEMLLKINKEHMAKLKEQMVNLKINESIFEGLRERLNYNDEE